MKDFQPIATFGICFNDNDSNGGYIPKNSDMLDHERNLPFAVLRISDDVLETTNEILRRVGTINMGTCGGLDDNECFGLNMRTNFTDWFGREVRLELEAEFKQVPQLEEIIALQVTQYHIYPNGIGIVRDIDYRDVRLGAVFFILGERFMNLGDLPTLKLLAQKI